MADGGIQMSAFIVKHDGGIDFSINQKTAVQEQGKVSDFSRQDKSDFPTGNQTRVSRLQVYTTEVS